MNKVMPSHLHVFVVSNRLSQGTLLCIACLVLAQFFTMQDGTRTLLTASTISLLLFYLYSAHKHKPKQEHHDQVASNSNDDFFELILKSPLPYFNISSKGQITKCNSRFASLLASSKEQIIGYNIQSYLPEKEHLLLLETLQKLATNNATQLPLELSVCFISPNNLKIPTRNYIWPEYDMEGHCSCAHIVSSLDTVARSAHEFKTYFNTFFDNLPAITYINDISGKCTHINQEALSVLQTPNHQILGKTYTDILPPDLARRFKVTAKRVIKTKKTERSTQTFSTTIDGPKRTYDTTLFPIFNTKNEVSSIGTIAFDITSHFETKEQLRHKNNQFRLALLERGIFYWTYNSDDKLICFDEVELVSLLAANPKKGFTITEYLELTHPEDVEGLREAFIQFFKGHTQTLQIEHRLIDSSGDEIWLKDIGEALEKDQNGQVKKAVGMAINISELKRTQQNLQYASNKAQEASEAKSAFVAQISHEIRTPLNAIIGINHLFEQTTLSQNQKNYVEKLKSASNQLLGIVNDVLDNAKIESGKVCITPYSFSLSELIQTSLVTSTVPFPKHIHITKKIDNTIPDSLYGDKLRISQVLINFFSNAYKFTPDGGHIDVEIILKEQKNNKVHLLFKVTDSGIGIAEEMQNHLFQTFHQIDPSITKNYGGTGLGLAISKKLVKLMGGEIGVESRLGQGSCFWFSLPLEVRPESPQEDNTVERNIQGTKVLLVEDNPLNQFMTCELLEKEGVIVELAHNGQKALELVVDQKKSYDIVLMDLQMPIVDGYAATKKIREYYDVHELPILATSANNSYEERESCLVIGMNDFVPKPLDPDLLFEQIHQWAKTSPRPH